MNIKGTSERLSFGHRSQEIDNKLLIDFFELLFEWEIKDKKNKNISLKGEITDQIKPSNEGVYHD